ncbi:MAG: LysR family transcriptional regulator [Solirubrobacterales bacterium]|nr:LysR family transcriptional regulator [Solirubrobacterales bacterium]
MELRQLDYLVAVAEEASFTRAAARCHVAQPGVSAQIRRLEGELGQALLHRSGTGVTLTAAGAAVLPYARAALGAARGVHEAADEVARLIRGRVRMGMVAASGAFAVADLLEEFHTRHPGVEIGLVADATDRLLDGLTEGALDLALVGLAAPVPEGLAGQLVLDDQLVAAVRRDHPLAARPVLALAELAERPLICVPRGTGMRAALQAGCASIGVQPRIALEAADPTVIAELAARDLGVAILPQSSRGIDPRLVTVPITEPRLHSRIELVWRPDETVGPAARALIADARAFFAAPSDDPGAAPPKRPRSHAPGRPQPRPPDHPNPSA